MADVAQGVQSSCCGTFSTVAGAYGDEQLSGSCQRCGKPITAPNPQYDATQAVGHFSARVLGPNGSIGMISASGINLQVSVQGITTVPEDSPEEPAPAPPAEVPERIDPESEQPESQDDGQ